MKRTKTVFSVLMALLMTCMLLFAACAPDASDDGTDGGRNEQDGQDEQQGQEEQVIPKTIALSGMRTQFAYGEAFSDEGLVVTVTMSDDTQRKAAESEYTVDASAYDADTAGTYSVMVSLKDYDVSASYTVTVAAEPVHTWDEDGALKILTIGNSFSDDMTQYAWQIADSLGVKEIYLGNLYIGGCSLDTHAANAANNAPAYEYRVNTDGTWNTTPNYRMGDAIASQDWDFVSLQQASGSSGIESTYGKLQELIDYVRKMLPADAHTQLVWHMTWAYQQSSTHAEFPKYDSNQQKMYQMIVQTVQNKILTNDAFSAVIPNGTAVQNARTSVVGDALTRDGYHLTYDLGRYIAGLTFLQTLTGLSVEEIAFAPDGMSAEDKAIAIESAVNACKTPFEVTQSAYTLETAIDLSKYTELEYTLTLGFYNSSDPNQYNSLITQDGNLSPKFFATKRFTPEELPIGTVILLKGGWQYRPEAWKTDAWQTSRPDNVTTRVVTVTPEWWSGYMYRAFNLAMVGLPVIEGKEQAAYDALKIYIPKEAQTLEEQGYREMNYELFPGFYNSTDDANFDTPITNNPSLSPKFFATKRFTKEELPVGTVIVVAEGWQYRPDAWKDDAVQDSRPGNSTCRYLVVTEEWWDGYIYRAFNLAKTDSSVLTGQEAAAKAAFKIYLPPEAQN